MIAIDAVNIVLIVNYLFVFAIAVYTIAKQDKRIKRLEKENVNLIFKLREYELDKRCD